MKTANYIRDAANRHAQLIFNKEVVPEIKKRMKKLNILGIDEMNGWLFFNINNEWVIESRFQDISSKHKNFLEFVNKYSDMVTIKINHKK